MKKSFVLPATFPSSKTGAEQLRVALDQIARFDFDTVEYYVENCDASEAGRLVRGWDSIFLCAALQKQKNLNPSSCDSAERKNAVALLADSMRFAVQAGAKSVLLNSGGRPDDEKKDADCLKYLRESLCELHRMADGVGILLEPGDRDIEYRHLIGHTDQADAFIQDLLRDIPDAGLVFDISHVAQLGEPLGNAWDTAKRSCSHVHLANCVLVEGARYYGDKHPVFGVADGVYSHQDAQAFYTELLKETKPMTTGIEIICHDGDETAFFNHIADETDWFFTKKPGC